MCTKFIIRYSTITETSSAPKSSGTRAHQLINTKGLGSLTLVYNISLLIVEGICLGERRSTCKIRQFICTSFQFIKQVISVANVIYWFDFSEESFPRLGQMIIDYEPPIKKLTEEFIPHSKVQLLSSSLFFFPTNSVKNFIRGICLTGAMQWCDKVVVTVHLFNSNLNNNKTKSIAISNYCWLGTLYKLYNLIYI